MLSSLAAAAAKRMPNSWARSSFCRVHVKPAVGPSGPLHTHRMTLIASFHIYTNSTTPDACNDSHDCLQPHLFSVANIASTSSSVCRSRGLNALVMIIDCNSSLVSRNISKSARHVFAVQHRIRAGVLITLKGFIIIRSSPLLLSSMSKSNENNLLKFITNLVQHSPTSCWHNLH